MTLPYVLAAAAAPAQPRATSMDVAAVPLHTSPLEVARDATLSTPRGTWTFTPGEPSVGVVPCPRSESVVRAANAVPVLVLLVLTAPLSAR